MRKRLTLLIGLLTTTCVALFAGSYTVVSPDGQIKITVDASKQLTWSVSRGGEQLFAPSAIALDVNGLKTNLGINPRVSKATKKSVDEMLTVDVPVKFKNIRDKYNQLTLRMKGGYSVEFRAYNNGAAYRFVTALPGTMTLNNETVELKMPSGTTTFWPMDPFHDFKTPQEVTFENRPVASLDTIMKGFLPIYMTTPAGTKVVFTEAGVDDYANLFLVGDSTGVLHGEFPHEPAELKLEGDRTEKYLSLKPHMTITDGTRNLPWRVAMIADNDAALLENTLPWQLSIPSVIGDASWIKPGKISWDWYSTLNVYGVDFESGVNTPTYKYIIDFAAANGLEYVLLDEGWSRSTWDISHYNDDVNVPELVAYGKERGVGIVLWALWNPLDVNLEKILDVYEGWGVKGIKIDFMNRSDQYMVNFYDRVARAAADRHLLVDFHGAYKPCGVQRKYPNVMTFEGVHGMEHNKDSRDISPSHNLTLPFTRMMAGPMDYTPGAAWSATADDYAINFFHPMSLGTRAQQAALFIVFESPLQMVADSPSNFKNAPELIKFVSKIPTVWDETRGIDARIAEYLVMARRNGDNWYVAALTDWNARDMEVKLDFLPQGEYTMTTFADGKNAHKMAVDTKVTERVVKSGDTVKFHMAPGGGWSAIIKPIAK